MDQRVACDIVLYLHLCQVLSCEHTCLSVYQHTSNFVLVNTNNFLTLTKQTSRKCKLK